MVDDLFHLMAMVIAWPVVITTGGFLGLAVIENLITAVLFPLRRSRFDE